MPTRVKIAKALLHHASKLQCRQLLQFRVESKHVDMQDMLPAFDPFGISNEPNEQSKSALGIVEAAQGDEEDEPSTPLSGAIKTQQKHKLGGRHRRTTSEPTPMDSWQLRSEWPQH